MFCASEFIFLQRLSENYFDRDLIESVILQSVTFIISKFLSGVGRWQQHGPTTQIESQTTENEIKYGPLNVLTTACMPLPTFFEPSTKTFVARKLFYCLKYQNIFRM
jgi:hypothetical protein